MREILYIQAGSLSNYTGTHFWNTQESYFAYDEDDVSLADHSISFREGRDPHNYPTLCPRLLVFDQKSNFGSLAKNRSTEEDVSSVSTWQGKVLRHEKERVPQSEYQAFLEAENEPNALELDNNPPETKVRFWSDYSRVFFDPKSIQPVPDTQENAEGDWTASQEIFRQYDKDVELMEGPVRLAIEECDNFQVFNTGHHALFISKSTNLGRTNDARHCYVWWFLACNVEIFPRGTPKDLNHDFCFTLRCHAEHG